MTFYGVTVAATVLGTALLYPGVRKHSTSAKNSLLAASMAAVLAATALALVVSALFNAASTWFG